MNSTWSWETWTLIDTITKNILQQPSSLLNYSTFHPSYTLTKNIPTFYGQKSSQRVLKRCWPTNEESCMGHRKKNRIISSSDLILFFLEIFRKGSQPPSFWTEIPQHIAKKILTTTNIHKEVWTANLDCNQT